METLKSSKKKRIGNRGNSSTMKATPQEEASFKFERSENPTTQRGVVVVVTQVGWCSSDRQPWKLSRALSKKRIGNLGNSSTMKATPQEEASF